MVEHLAVIMKVISDYDYITNVIDYDYDYIASESHDYDYDYDYLRSCNRLQSITIDYDYPIPDIMYVRILRSTYMNWITPRPTRPK